MRLFDFPISQINEIGTLGNTTGSAFAQLGSGTLYGEKVITGGRGVVVVVDIDLNQAAIDAINAALTSADKRFVIGSALVGSFNNPAFG